MLLGAAAAAAAAAAAERLVDRATPARGRAATAAAKEEADALWERMMAAGAGAASASPAEETVEVAFSVRVEEADAPAGGVRGVTVYGDVVPLRLSAVRRRRRRRRAERPRLCPAGVWAPP